MLGFCPLASGSKGNAIYLGTKQTKILIDAGLSAKRIISKLNEINIDISEIDAILITHEHFDHIQGLKVLAGRMGIPVFANHETAKGIVQNLQKYPKFKLFSTGETFEFKDLEIHPFTVQHDTLDPVAFTIKVNSLKLGFCTDLGFVTNLVKTRLQDCDYLYVEANHEPDWVNASARPEFFKQRVLSRSGHLSNAECADLLINVYHPGLKHVHLAHLSQECNSHENALKQIKDILSEKGIDLNCSVAPQDKLSAAVHF